MTVSTGSEAVQREDEYAGKRDNPGQLIREVHDRNASPPLLRRLFEAAGYRLEDRPLGLRALRLADRRGVFFADGEPNPADLEDEFPSETVHRTVVYAEDPGPLARALAADRRLEVLDGSTLGPGLGELLLLTQPETPSEGSEEGDAWASPLGGFVEGERVIRPHLGESEAVAIAGVDGFRYLLRLLPFFLAAYRVRVPTPHGGRGPVTQHLVAVNALSGRIEVWEEGEREFIGELVEPHERLEPVLTESDCRQLAEEELRRRHTAEVDHVEQHQGAIVIERRRVPPASGDLRVGPAVLVHVPYWYVESPEGRVILDAVTGRRVGPADEAGVAEPGA
ncbi:MAG: hypothetical protein WCA77_02785 [Thermoplasmata archaeon]